MKKLILGSVIGIALSGCSETVNYDWLAGDWSCNIEEFDYNYDLQKYNEQGRIKFIDYDRHIEIIKGKAYEIVYETFTNPIHETKFQTAYKEVENYEDGDIIITHVYTAKKISNSAFIQVKESELLNNKKGIKIKGKIVDNCKLVEY